MLPPPVRPWISRAERLSRVVGCATVRHDGAYELVQLWAAWGVTVHEQGRPSVLAHRTPLCALPPERQTRVGSAWVRGCAGHLGVQAHLDGRDLGGELLAQLLEPLHRRAPVVLVQPLTRRVRRGARRLQFGRCGLVDFRNLAGSVGLGADT
jgi:hypothetical protein